MYICEGESGKHVNVKRDGISDIISLHQKMV